VKDENLEKVTMKFVEEHSNEVKNIFEKEGFHNISPRLKRGGKYVFIDRPWNEGNGMVHAIIQWAEENQYDINDLPIGLIAQNILDEKVNEYIPGWFRKDMMFNTLDF